MKKTKVICTMGPNTNDRELIKQLALSGMDIARFNFSHGDHEEQAGRFALVKSVREEINKPIATLLDTKGPEIRTGVLKDDKKVTLKEGQKFTLTTRDIVGDDTIDMITYAGLPADVANGNTILIDDGLITGVRGVGGDFPLFQQCARGGEQADLGGRAAEVDAECVFFHDSFTPFSAAVVRRF